MGSFYQPAAVDPSEDEAAIRALEDKFAAAFNAGASDSITLGSGADTVNAMAGNDLITLATANALGGGNATVYGAAGDTIAAPIP